LALKVTLDPDLAVWRRGDAVRLRQILSNLMSNAVRFTHEGSVEVRIEGDAAGLVAIVRDTGVGIPAERLERIFDRFFQVDGSTTRSANGAGLGLTIAQRVAQVMGGDIAVESVVGAGSCFTARLPLPAAPVQAAPGAPVGAVSLQDDGLRVLIVDDNDTNRSVLCALLAPLGIACGTAADGRAAVSAFKNEHWDAVLMDIHMPQMDGLAASRAIRAHETRSGRPRTPIIAVTASVLSHETEQYFAAGMDDVVAKPIEFTRLLSALEACLTAREPAPAAIAV
jgi:CheY-like chemotaxis protein/anti-sigma regulatory factor (Ser/Thr protein kinase)